MINTHSQNKYEEFLDQDFLEIYFQITDLEQNCINELIEKQNISGIINFIEEYINKNTNHDIEKAIYFLNKAHILIKNHNSLIIDYILEKIGTQIDENKLKPNLYTYSIYYNYQLYNKFHTGNYEYGALHRPKITSMIENLFEELENNIEISINHIPYISCLIVNLSLYQIVNPNTDNMVYNFQKIISIISKVGVFKEYIFFTYSHFIYFLINAQNQDHALIKKYITICENEIKSKNYKENYPYIYVQFKLIAYEYLLGLQTCTLNISHFNELKEIIEKNDCDDCSKITLNRLIGLYYIKEEENIIKRNLAKNLTHQDYCYTNDSENTKNAKAHLTESIKLAQDNDDCIKYIKSMISLLEIENDFFKIQELFFLSRGEIKSHFGNNIGKISLGKKLINIGIKYNIIQFDIKSQDNPLQTAQSIIDLKYKDYQNFLNNKRLTALLSINGCNDFEKNILNLIKQKFNYIRICIYNNSNNKQLINLGFDEYIHTFINKIENTNIWTELPVNSNDIKNNFFSLTLIGKKIKLGNKEYTILIDKTAYKDKPFEETQLMYLNSIAEKVILNKID